jgi:TRAP-type C4-dicarboxylate transport system permease small subunit
MRFIARIANAQLVLAMLALLTMGAVTITDVFLKYVFNRPVVGAYDLVESLLPIVIFYGLPATLLRRQSIIIDLIDHVGGPRWVRPLTAVADVIVLGIFVMIAWAFLSPAKLAFDYGDRKIELDLPIAVIWALVIVGMAGVILAAAANVVTTGRGDEGTTP